jgi:hypothetical protein
MVEVSEIIGQKEGLKLEFKAKDALKRPEVIGRGVVGMLNAEGGVLWVGVQETKGTAVSLQPVENAELERQRLLNHLVDTVEPSPRGSEINVEAVEVGGLGHLLRVEARPEGGRKPYAQFNSGGRHYHIRIGDRIRSMSRDELREAWKDSTQGEEEEIKAALSEVLKEREEARARGREMLWLLIRPSSAVELDIQQPWLASLLRDPSQTGNRLTRWGFANPYREPDIKQGRLSQGLPDGIETAVFHCGKITLCAPLRSLHHQSAEKEILPYALLEFPTSVFRLASRIYRTLDLPKDSRVIADLAVFGLAGWTLRPYSPSEFRYLLHPAEHEEWPFPDGDDFVLESPFRFPAREVREDPDWCAYQLISRVYEAYGHSRDVIPREFDPQSRKLLLSG